MVGLYVPVPAKTSLLETQVYLESTRESFGLLILIYQAQ